MIYFAVIRLWEPVHAQALGFTETVYAYVEAEFDREAELLARAWYETKYGSNVRSVSAEHARVQGLHKHLFVIRAHTGIGH